MTQENENVDKFIQFHADHPEVFPWVAARLREPSP
jgi:hypothetical protein